MYVINNVMVCIKQDLIECRNQEVIIFQKRLENWMLTICYNALKKSRIQMKSNYAENTSLLQIRTCLTITLNLFQCHALLRYRFCKEM